MQMQAKAIQAGPEGAGGTWLDDPRHRAFLLADLRAGLDLFRGSLRADGGFDVLDPAGRPLPRGAQELHTTTRLVHSYALAQAMGDAAAAEMVDAGVNFLWTRHRDAAEGGYFWSVDGSGSSDAKLAYGHVFVLLAASSALQAGHPQARALFDDIAAVIDTRFWDEAAGRLDEEFARDWSPISGYRGMNANMHGAEAFLAAYEATGEGLWLERAGRILDFFVGQMAPRHGWRIPEHYHADWSVDPGYCGNPMFRPAGTTPGHSLELARLRLQHWELAGRPDSGAPQEARNLAGQALRDAWGPAGGLAYTLGSDGKVAIPDRYWWPVAEGIGALAALIKAGGTTEDEAWYRRLWDFAAGHFIDTEKGGWFPEIDAGGRPAQGQFAGKPDLYHALQASLLPLLPGLARPFDEIRDGALAEAV